MCMHASNAVIVDNGTLQTLLEVSQSIQWTFLGVHSLDVTARQRTSSQTRPVSIPLGDDRLQTCYSELLLGKISVCQNILKLLRTLVVTFVEGFVERHVGFRCAVRRQLGVAIPEGEDTNGWNVVKRVRLTC